MRNLLSALLATLCVLITGTTGFAQKYASEESARIKDLLDRYQAVFGPAGSSEGAALSALCMTLDAVPKAECLEKAKFVTRLYRNSVTLLKDQGEKIDALPEVYNGHYKRARVSDMAVTDQIGMATFQYAYISFLMWYIQCYPLPHVGKVPLEVPLNGSGDSQSPSAPLQSPRLPAPK
jgi:hypothetical protein